MRRAQHTTQWGRRGRAIAAAGLLVLAACGDEPSYFGPSHVESKVAYERPTETEAGDGAAVVRHVATRLWAPIVEAAGTDNVAYSPLSIATALGMARAGAEGPSGAQLDELFGLPGTTSGSVHRAVGGADATLRSLAGPVQLADGSMGEIDLSTANAVWGQSGVAWEDPFLDVLAADYEASIWNADYRGDPEAARRDINDWVASRTAERITGLLPEGALTTDTQMVLTNAAWFSAPWEAPMEEQPAAPFTTAAGERVEAPMLATTGSLVHRTGPGWQSVTVPYAGGDLAMTLLVPDAGALAEVEAALDDDLLVEATTGGEATVVALTFPRFAFDARAELKAALQAIGVEAPFATEDDFLPMTRDPEAQPLWVDDVLHQATIAVDELGTEASAATAVVMTTEGALLPEVELTVDCPFLFVIHDVALGTPLFVGRVADPVTSG